jgi:BirA family transcriptional regulator, biotin operon repressor / biotin---[acetyl-CoA-carboxylase] ligase
MPRDLTPATMLRRQRLLEMLSDGAFHSGEKLAKRLRLSRGGIWKIVSALRELGIEIQSVPRQGYRLPRSIDLYDKAAILAASCEPARAALVRTDVLLTVDSTNRFINDLTDTLKAGNAQLCVAELQNAGRGRRGRSWVAPFGSGICMSVGWQFADAPPTFSALSLAIGVAVVTALRNLGASDVGLKWPNDLLWKGRKLGGILVELRGESAGPAHVVIGIGINVRMPTVIRLLLAEQQAAVISDVYEILRERTPNRNVIVGAVLSELIATLNTFATEGFAPFHATWQRLDALAASPVKVINGSQTTLGIARGVDADGTLLVDVNDEIRRFASGEVSLRAAHGK